MTTRPVERLQKVLARAGVASRRKSEDLIRRGRVTVNGQVVTRLGTKVDAERDEIRVDGRRVEVVQRHTYILLHKPPGVISAMRDRRGRRALGDLVSVPTRLYPVGRLDYDSAGLILLTDDGELANLLTHPRYEHEKEYHVWVDGAVSDEAVARWQGGVSLEDGPTAPAEVEVLARHAERSLLRIVMHEGRKRQIRRVAEQLGYPVRELVRVRIGPLHLGNLDAGRWRPLTTREVERLEDIKRRYEKPGRGPRRLRRQ
jgi:23S rRNA pseudouridine2605 synthase